MANLTFFENGRPGLRLQDVFAPIAGEVAFSGSGALQTASLTTTLNDGLVITLRYTGSPISAARGDVHLLSIDTADGTVIRYGDPTAPRHEFSYQDLAGFHRGGAAAAAVAMAGDDRIVGSSNDEYLEGYAGDDALVGKAGADTLAGGTGDDTYIVDDPRAIVVEHLGEGVDSVSSTVSFALPAGMEIETLMASGDASVNLTGNSYANLVIGNDGSNLIRGGAGDDTIRGEAGHDVLFGDAGQDVLVAGAGNDALHGGEGNDEIHGGDGNNALFGDEGNDDIRAGSGNDEISGGEGADHISGEPGNDRLSGDDGADVLDGGADNDELYGGAGFDTLRGGAGHDTLSGDDGADLLEGGDDNDSLRGEAGDDFASGGNGQDWIDGGAGGDKLLGAGGNDTILGGEGRDALSGGAGSDKLFGGIDRDVFVFATRLDGRSNIDRIGDFQVKLDRIHLDNAIFKKVGSNGALKKDAFHGGATAHDKTDRILYDRDSGTLYSDSDGTGPASRIKFAILEKNLKITAAHFFVI